MKDSKTVSLFEIVNVSQQIERELIESGGELSRELELVIDNVGTALAEKAESYIFVTRRLEANAAFFKEEAEKYTRAAKALCNASDRLKDKLKEAMVATGKDEIIGDTMKIVLSDSQPKLVVEDETKIPQSFKIVKYEIDKSRIKDLLKTGEEIPGASLETGKTLRTYINKGTK